MESSHLRASSPGDDDSVSILSHTEPSSQSSYHPYNSDDSFHYHSSSETPLYRPAPPGQHANLPSPPPSMEPSLFGSTAVHDVPYSEPVAWANSTQFRYTNQEAPKPETVTANFATTDSRPQETRRYFRHPRHIPEPWMAGWARLPRWGFAAILVILLLTGTSAGILLASDGMTPEDWRVGFDNAQPYVYVSVFEMMIDFLMLFALADGMTIRFWRKLLHGTTLSYAHDIYESAELWPALQRAIRLRFNAVAIASILTALSFLRGPLFQRALTISAGGTTTYHTNRILVALGVLLSIAGVVAILSLYHGFWELGRKVSMNPLEIARAFGAPLLEGLDGNATPDKISIERGGMGVRYGVLERNGQEKKLRIEESSRVAVRVPWKGEILG